MKAVRWLGWAFLVGWFLGGLVRGWIDRRALDRQQQEFRSRYPFGLFLERDR